MKFFAVFALVVASAFAQVEVYHTSEYDAPIIRSEYESSPDGSAYHHTIETGNGIVQQAEGSVRNINSETPVYEVKGAVSYTAPDGTPVQLTYTADENGYRASGSHIPVSPPIPELILRSLQYLEAHPAAPVVEYVAKAN